MIESAARWLFLCCAIFLSGTLTLLWSARAESGGELARWRARCVAAARLLALAALVFACASASLQAMQIAQTSGGFVSLERFLSTRTGQVWVARIGLLALVLVLLTAWRKRLSIRSGDLGRVERPDSVVPSPQTWGEGQGEGRSAKLRTLPSPHPLPRSGARAFDRAGATTPDAAYGRGGSHLLAVCAVLALAALTLGGLSGHAAAFDPAWPVMFGQALHLAAAGLWLGALPALAYLFHSHAPREAATALLQRFSSRALLLMLAIVASGVPLADLQIETIPALIGTHYGATLIWKLVFLAGVLAAAAHLRFKLLPRLTGGAASPAHVARWIALELLLALAVVWCAAELGRTVPARHDNIVWPFDFRYSIDATWPDAKLRERIVMGGVVAALGVLFAWIGFVQRMRLHRWLPPFLILLTVGLVILLQYLKIDAYPGTYRKSTVPYQALSVANGARLFAEHCATCHGHAGHGDGAQAASLPIRPADLTEAHTALHTAGDLFWWLTHGKPPGIMPGFAQALSEDERWDLINFLRALAAGYQARIIGERIVPMKPWLAAPDFSFVTASGASGTLKDFRGQRAVLLIIGSGEGLRARRAQLAAQAQTLRAADVQVLVVGRDALENAGAMAESVVAEGNAEIAATYALLRRTLANPDRLDRDALPAHVEFLIDKQGYVRARWVPSENARVWRDTQLLRRQIEALAREPRVLPPPDDHVH